MIKVAHFITPNGLYGAERWILALLNHINKSKIQIILICDSSSNLSLLNEAKMKGIKTKSLNVKSNFSLLEYMTKLSELLKKEKIDILHTHGYKSDLIGLFSARKMGIKIISTPHGWSVNAGVKLKIYEGIDKIALGFFDCVAPLSEQIKQSLLAVNKRKIKLIHNFVDLESLPTPKNGDFNLITYTGQLVERKRVQDLIKAMQFVDNKNAKLQIIGDGPRRKELEKLAKNLNLENKITFLGFRKNRLELLNKSAIFVLPSDSEGISRALMEAMTMGKLVIGTDIPGISDLIINKKTGLLVPIRSPEKIADAINWILDHEKESKNIAKNASVKIKKEFSAEKAAKEYEKLYNSLM
jgi:glycosyltransferase involved in cell wall biosynthesis